MDGGHSFNMYTRRGEGGQANAYECIQGGRGRWHIKYVRKAQNYNNQLFADILQYFHLQRTHHCHVNSVLRIQLKSLLVQWFQTYVLQAKSDNVAPRNVE